jgi:hypothetical protein
MSKRRAIPQSVQFTVYIALLYLDETNSANISNLLKQNWF